jgi:hypothetical protein
LVRSADTNDVRFAMGAHAESRDKWIFKPRSKPVSVNLLCLMAGPDPSIGFCKALQLPPPIKVDETRNSILLVGIGGVGKTSLIKALTHDPAAEPDTAGPFKIYKHVEELGNEPSGVKRTNLYFADYRGQNLTNLIGGVLDQRKQPYCS